MTQWIRQCNLVVSDAGGKGIDLSAFRIVFEVGKTQNETPNHARIKVYNIAKETESQFIKEGQRVILQAGYKENFGVIFDGKIVQVRKGRENNTDTYVEITSFDGDTAYNFAFVNTTLAAGSSQADHVAAAQKSMGVSASQIDTAGQKLPRGKVMFGSARDTLRQSARSNGQNWSIQDGKLQIIKKDGLLNKEAVILNSKTGLVGEPEQSSNGITAKCLLNPMIRIGAKVIINEADIQTAQIPLTDKKDPANAPAKIAKDGAYKVIWCTYKGDTRGQDWYCEVVCIDVAAVVKK